MWARAAALRPSPPQVYQEMISLAMDLYPLFAATLKETNITRLLFGNLVKNNVKWTKRCPALTGAYLLFFSFFL